MHLGTELLKLRQSQQELVDQYGAVAARHGGEYEIREGCKLFAQWSTDYLTALTLLLKRMELFEASSLIPLSNSLFQHKCPGSYSLLCDMEDLLLLAQRAHMRWLTISQAASSGKQLELVKLSYEALQNTERQINWLRMQVKNTAPQTLTGFTLSG